MGVKTLISLDEINEIFPSFNFIKLTPTVSGIIDTTYIAHTQTKEYILKKYERDIGHKIIQDIKLLDELKSSGLNVPTCIERESGWYIYEKLRGKQPKVIKTYHIQALARFLAKLHKQTFKTKCDSYIITEDEVAESLKYVKANFFGYYKKFDFLKNFTYENDGLIHGDIFKDNTVFDDTKVGVFDFIDSTCGSFTFDAAVTLVGFDVKVHNPCFINLFLRSYNQHAPRKISKKTLLQKIKVASHYYALKRVHKYKNAAKAKELIRWI